MNTNQDIAAVNLPRRSLIATAIGAGVAAAFPAIGFGQAYPSKPIRWILPFAVGGGSDILARLLAREIEKDIGQQVIVDNRPGGNTVIAVQAMMGMPADGHTMMSVGVDTLVTNRYIYNVPYDPQRDFELVATMARFPHVLVARKDFPGNSSQESLDYIRRPAKGLNYATWGTGSMAHLAMEVLFQRIGAKGTPVPYKGSAPALTDLMGGQIDLFISDVASAQQHIRSGGVKAIGMTGKERYPGLPEVPTLSEVGVSGFDLVLWQGVMMRSGTPAPVVDKMSAAIRKALTDPAVVSLLNDRGFQAMYRNPSEFREFVKGGDAVFGNVIKQAGIRAD